MAKAATKRRPKAVEQLQMQVDTIVGRAAAGGGPVTTEERITSDGEIIDVPVRAAPAFEAPFSEPEPTKEPFGRWLIGQVAMRRTDAIGDLAKMAKGDPGFPKQGDVDEVRRRIGLAGADGDAFEALDDAEREYERL